MPEPGGGGGIAGVVSSGTKSSCRSKSDGKSSSVDHASTEHHRERSDQLGHGDLSAAHLAQSDTSRNRNDLWLVEALPAPPFFRPPTHSTAASAGESTHTPSLGAGSLKPPLFDTSVNTGSSFISRCVFNWKRSSSSDCSMRKI